MTVTWVLEKNVFSEKCFGEMVEHFEQNNIPYHVIRVKPFVHELPRDEMDENDPVFHLRTPVVVYGSIGVQKVAEAEGWSPGIWTGCGFDEFVLCDKLGDHYLNNDMVVTQFNNAGDKARELGWDTFFIKPNTDSKEFAGELMEADDFAEWRQRLIEIGYLDNYTFPVAMSTPKRIGKEWRLVMLDKKVIGASKYRDYQKRTEQVGAPDEVIKFAEMIADIYAPYDVFVLDVVETNDGLKVIEYNTFNSAGLYACEVGPIIDAINKFVEG